MARSSSSAIDPRQPVIVGVGEFVQRPDDIDDPTASVPSRSS